MGLLTLALLAVGLAMDACAVAVAQGIRCGQLRWGPALLLAASFGLFQGIMPILGWALGLTIADLVSAFDHWLAFAVLSLVGGHMLLEWWNNHPQEGDAACAWPSCRALLWLSLATSIDAFAVGLTFPALEVPILWAALIIAVVTMVLSLLALILGRMLGNGLGRAAELAGGLIVIAIGVKILVDHTIIYPYG